MGLCRGGSAQEKSTRKQNKRQRLTVSCAVQESERKRLRAAKPRFVNETPRPNAHAQGSALVLPCYTPPPIPERELFRENPRWRRLRNS
jgi:hypothetical protein